MYPFLMKASFSSNTENMEVVSWVCTRPRIFVTCSRDWRTSFHSSYPHQCGSDCDALATPVSSPIGILPVSISLLNARFDFWEELLVRPVESGSESFLPSSSPISVIEINNQSWRTQFDNEQIHLRLFQTLNLGAPKDQWWLANETITGPFVHDRAQFEFAHGLGWSSSSSNSRINCDSC